MLFDYIIFATSVVEHKKTLSDVNVRWS